VTDDDRAFVASLGGTVTYEFRGFPALLVRMTAGSLLRFAQSVDYPRLVHVELGLRVYPAACS
jgi:hypothetical protein